MATNDIEDYIEIFGVKIESGHSGMTDSSVEFLNEHLKKLGKLNVMTFKDELTTIIGTKGKIVLTGVGFGDGFGGKGHWGFEEVLKILGINEKEWEEKRSFVSKQVGDQEMNLGEFTHFFK